MAHATIRRLSYYIGDIDKLRWNEPGKWI